MESWQETGLAFGIDTAMSGVFILWETWWWSQQVVLIFKLENQILLWNFEMLLSLLLWK